jgi:hypothetical protein
MTYRYALVIATMVGSLMQSRAAIAAFRPGDIIVGGSIPAVGGFPGVETGKLRQFAPDGTLIQEFYSVPGTTIDVKFSPSGVLHTSNTAGGFTIARFANDASQLPSLTAPTTSSFHSLAFDRAGDLFASTREGVVVKFGNSPPDLIPLEPVSFTSEWVDLDSDQCTLYYLRDAALPIGRFDVCAHTMLSPLPTAINASGPTTLLVLADNTLLVSAFGGGVYRIRQDGTLLRHYTTFAIAYGRDADPRFVWVALPGVVHSAVAKLDLQNDVFAAGPFEAGIDVTGIAIVGADAPSSIPALSPLLLALLALCVSVSAVMRMRQ